MHEGDDSFSAKPSGKSSFHLLTDWSGRLVLKNHLIANDFLSIRIFIYRLLRDVTYIQLDRPELHRRYSESGGDLNPKNLGAY